MPILPKQLHFFKKINIKDIIIENLQIKGRQVRFKVCAYVGTMSRVNVYLGKLFSKKQEEICRGQYVAREGKLDEVLEKELDIWHIKSSNLYTIRLSAVDTDGREWDEAIVETGFRTIEQKEGNILLNGGKFC